MILLTVYIDILLVTDWILDYFLLLLVKRITLSSVTRLRLLLGTSVAALSSLILLLPSLPLFFNILYLIFFSALIVFIAFSFTCFSSFLQRWLWYLVLNAAFGGIAFCLSQLGMIKNILYQNLFWYIPLSPLTLIAAIALSYLLIQLLLFLGTPVSSSVKSCTIQIKSFRFSTEVLLDTGFHLEDALTGHPVLLLRDLSVCPSLLRQELQQFQNAGDASLSFRYLPAQSLFGSGLLPAVTADAVSCGKQKLSQITIAFAPDFAKEEPAALAGCALFQQF